MNLFEELNQLMVKYRFRPNKKLAQFFIIDSDAIEALIKTASLKPNDVALEIGAGTGFLTRELQKHCKTIAIELDDNLFPLLKTELPKENLLLLHGNFLELKIPKFTKAVSLPPYTISSDIMYRLFELGFEEAVLVFQLEFAGRLAALPGFFEYNALSVACQYFSDVEIIKKIPPGSFFPSPKVDSAIIRLKWKNRKKKVKDTKAFIAFLKSLFRFSNKNLCNALEKAFPFMQKELGISKKDFEKKISGIKIRDVKVKLIYCEEFVDIFNNIFEK